MYLLLKDVQLRVLEIMPEVASCLKVTNQNNGSEDQVDDTLATYIVTFILRQETMGNAARSHHVFVEQTNKKNWKKIHSYEIRRDLLLRRNVCNIQFCWSLTRDINNRYRGARTYSPEPSITLQNIHKSVINPSKIPRIFYTNWQNKNNNTRAEKIRLQNDENHNNWFSKLP